MQGTIYNPYGTYSTVITCYVTVTYTSQASLKIQSRLKIKCKTKSPITTDYYITLSHVRSYMRTLSMSETANG